MKPERREQMAEEASGLIEQVARLKTELADTKEFLEALLEHIPEAVIIVDSRDLTVKMVSKYCRELFGQSKEKLEGISCHEYGKIHELVDPEGSSARCDEFPLVRSALKGEIVTNEEWLLKRSDGKKLHLLCNSGPILDRNGKTIAGINIWRDVTEDKRTQEELRTSYTEARRNFEQELEAKSYRLREVNSALKTLLRQRDEDRKELEEALLTNIENLIIPYIKRLKTSSMSSSQSSLLEILESHLKELTSKFGKTLALEYRVLTPTEMRVAALVREGKTSKEIADLLCVSEKTASFHRNNIRIKLGLRGTGGNLRSHLLSLA